MRRSCWLILALLALGNLAHAASVGTPGYLDEANGFRDVTFGTPIDSFTRLEEAGSEGPGKPCYQRADDELQAGDATLSRLRYCFVDRRLWAVVLEAIGPHNSEALNEFMAATYGPGQLEMGTRAGGPQRYVWRGRAVAAYYGELVTGMSAQVRIWSLDVERAAGAGRPAYDYEPGHTGHAHHDTRPLALQGRAEFALNVPQHARPGLTVQLSARFRNLGAPARVRIDVPPAMRIVQTIPPANIEPGGTVVWSDIGSTNGSLKIKAQIHPQAELGRALLIRSDVVDGSGGRQQDRATIVLR